MEVPNTCNGNAILQHIHASALPTQPPAGQAEGNSTYDNKALIPSHKLSTIYI